MKYLFKAATTGAAMLALSACNAQQDGDNKQADPRLVNAGLDGAPVMMREDGRGERVSGTDFATRSAVHGRNGMAATSHPLATMVAIDTLKKGGSAVDAAIAANAALGLMEPAMNGIGGDLFAIIWDPKTEKLYGLNAAGRAARGQSLADLKIKVGDGNAIPAKGKLSVSVPGTVDGWFEMHGKFGKLTMQENLAPIIAYAREGVPVHEVIARNIRRATATLEAMDAKGTNDEIDNFKATFLIDGKPPVEGQIFKNPDLANSYSLIAEGGRDAFYKGPIADTIDAYFKRLDGPLRKVDFEMHTSTWIEPVSVNYHGYDIWELPPQGQGIAALQMLNILEGYDLKAMGHNSADYLHVMTEAKKLAFEDRARFYADPDFYTMNMDVLLSKDYAAERRKLIDMDKAANEVDHGDPKLIEGDTIYLTVADKDGMMVSLIQSNFNSMGSGLVPDGLGFALQNRASLFSLDESHPNAYAPGKRPFHTIIPAFITKDGAPYMSFGLMGGPMQPQGHTQMVVNIIDFGMGVQQSGDAARYHHRGSTEPTWIARMKDGGILELEKGMKADVVRELQRRGHKVRITRGPFGGYQAIIRNPETGVYSAGTEMRKDGMAIGY